MVTTGMEIGQDMLSQDKVIRIQGTLDFRLWKICVAKVVAGITNHRTR